MCELLNGEARPLVFLKRLVAYPITFRMKLDLYHCQNMLVYRNCVHRHNSW